MIDYSVYMLPNQIDKTAAPKAYARAQMRENLSFKRFAEHVANHGSGYSKGAVQGIISDLCACIVEQLLNGNKVQLSELGDFWISLSSEGAESMKEFTSDNINAVNIVFTPGKEFENLISKAEFNVVASRIAQAATLKAEKENATTVDLEAARAAAKGGNSGTGASGTTSGDTGNPDGGSNPGDSIG